METDLGKGLGSQSLLSMQLCDLQQKAKALLIDIEHVETSKIRKGWERKGKGLLQVLWERGFIDKSKLKQYRKECLMKMETSYLKFLCATCLSSVMTSYMK